MRRTLPLLLLFLFDLNLGFSQKFNPQVLNDIAINEQLNASQRQARIVHFLKTANTERTIKLENGNLAVMYDVKEGFAEYKTTYNIQARQTTGVEFIQSTAGLNLPLFGKGLTIGVWDGGLVLNNHQEFQNRIKNKLGTSYSNHATHVTGTIAASGVNSNAKGMVPEATIHSYYAFDNDLGPMAEEASNGLILSNHSYGLILGWHFDNGWKWFGQENGIDNRFGSYTNTSKSIDNIAYNAPFYTIVWSAGNDRSNVGDGTRPPDGPYSIIGPSAGAKNIITVGAITGFENYVDPESAVMSGFSSWGPTNDGRIKPDLVADGVGVFSTGSAGSEAYSTLSGTSMSAPNVTGTLALLQDYYFQAEDNFMRAAELKSLAIHTAREAGAAEGPDYKFGWGVINAIDALKVLQSRNNKDTLLVYSELQNGETHEFSLFPSSDSKVTATIAWTDVPGIVMENGSTSPMLVNDLDIFFVDDAGNIEYPWTLNPNNLAQSSRKGDNILDNVEKIEFVVPNVRNYKLIVKHKGELVNNSQKYALTLTYQDAGINEDLAYWVKDDGDFQSGLNFSTISGGESESFDLENIKTLTIDENSFMSDGSLILSNDLVLDNIIFTTNNLINLNLNGHTLTVNNAIYSIGENFKITNGKIILKSDSNNDIYLNFDGSENLIVELDNIGIYNIKNDLNIDQFNILSGNYFIENKNVMLNGLNILESSNLTLTNNDINFSGLLNNLSDSLVLNDNNWLLSNAIVSSEFPVTTNDIVSATGNSSFSGQFNFSKLISNSKIEFFNAFRVDSLILNNGSNIIINASDTLIVKNGVKLNGNELKQISGSDPNLIATLEFIFRSKLCLENLSVSNIYFNSQSVLNVTSGGAINNSINVLELPCNELIFPNFSFSTNCVNSLIKLSNFSEGDINEYSWDFGNGLELDGINNSPNPVFWYSEVGDYEIKLTVSNELQTQDFTRNIQITENQLNPITIIENQQGLVASVPGTNFQWFKDGIAMESETGRILSEFESGIYNVAYFTDSENGCQSTVSDSFEYLITANKNLLLSNVKLFPNPVNNILTVEGLEKSKEFLIFDFQGRIVENKIVDPLSTKIEIDVSSYESGLYFFKLIQEKQDVQLKFLIK